MKIYFLSSRPCALNLNDAYFGVTDGFERFAELSLKDRIFVRFLPENALPIGFFLTENIRFSPPAGCEVYLLRDGIALYARDFPPCELSLKTIAQAREGNCLVTLFQQGEVQLSVESERGFFVSTLPPSFAQGELFFAEELVFVKAPSFLAVYTKKGERVFCEKTIDFEIDNGELKAWIPLLDTLGRIAECTFSLSERGCERTQFVLKQARTQSGETDEQKIRDELLPYAFFESVLIGANYREMLSDELADKADEIGAFLGDFVAVSQTDDPNVCALVRNKAERLFALSYFTVEVENGKISEIKG